MVEPNFLKAITDSELPEREDLLREARAALAAKPETEIKEHIHNTGNRLREALESGEAKQIKRAVREFQNSLRTVVNGEESSQSERKELKFPSLPNPPRFTQAMAKAFLEACGGIVNMDDCRHRIITVDDKTYEDSPKALLQRVGNIVFGKRSALRASIRYITLIAEGNTHEEAKAKAEAKLNNRPERRERAFPSLPNPPELTQAMAKAFIEACGG